MDTQIEFRQARNYQPADRKVGDISWLVIHCMQVPEKGDTAEACARFFATTDRKASAHYCLDSDSIVQSVRDQDVAYAAAGGNRRGLHFELAGYGAQVPEEWLDPYGVQMLGEQAAPLMRLKAEQYEIPIVYVDAAGLKAGRPGMTTHFEVEKAFPSTGHTDPGKGFPIAWFLAAMQGPPKPQPLPEEDDMKKFLVRQSDKPEVYVTDFVRYARHIDQAGINTLKHVGAVVTTFPAGVTVEQGCILVVNPALLAGLAKV